MVPAWDLRGEGAVGVVADAVADAACLGHSATAQLSSAQCSALK